MPFLPEPVCSALSTVAFDHHPAIREHCQKCRGVGECCLLERLRELYAAAADDVRH